MRTVREVLEALVLDLKLQGVEEELGVVLHERSERTRGEWRSIVVSIYSSEGAKKKKLGEGGKFEVEVTLGRGGEKKRRTRRSHTHQHLHLRHVNGAHLPLTSVLPEVSFHPLTDPHGSAHSLAGAWSFEVALVCFFFLNESDAFFLLLYLTKTLSASVPSLGARRKKVPSSSSWRRFCYEGNKEDAKKKMAACLLLDGVA